MKKITKTIAIYPDVWETLSKMAEKQRCSRSQLIQDLIVEKDDADFLLRFKSDKQGETKTEKQPCR